MTLAGLNETEMPAGNPDAERETVPEKRLTLNIVILVELLLPTVSLKQHGLADRLNPGTVTVIVTAESLRPRLEHLTITVKSYYGSCMETESQCD